MSKELEKAYETRNFIETKASYYLSAFSVLGITGLFKIINLDRENILLCGVDAVKISFLLFSISLLLNLISWFVSIDSFDEYIDLLKEKIKKQKKTQLPKKISDVSLLLAICGFVFLLISFMSI